MSDTEQDKKLREVNASTMRDGMAKDQNQPQQPQQPHRPIDERVKDYEARQAAEVRREQRQSDAAERDPELRAELERRQEREAQERTAKERFEQQQRDAAQAKLLAERNSAKEAQETAAPSGYKAYADQAVKEQEQQQKERDAQTRQREQNYSQQTQPQMLAAEAAAKLRTESQAKDTAHEVTAPQLNLQNHSPRQTAAAEKRQKAVAQPTPTPPTTQEAQRSMAYYAARRNAQTNRHAPLREMSDRQQAQYEKRANAPARENTDARQASAAVSSKDKKHERDGNGR